MEIFGDTVMYGRSPERGVHLLLMCDVYNNWVKHHGFYDVFFDV